MKVKVIWHELVVREDILEVDSLEEAHDTEINLGEGDVVHIELNSGNDIHHEVIEN
tara:strand:- start:686 stop:853 length:168 start_codon:yes stop_codon:yes gene_type:complete